ncbi:stAR-related lipid transfer protein 5 isoform X1 [Poeciliopsis prolifica]|uniref:stAR-related lipid transfer protein 5 isoform X1 n=1 Tax=Poeciliopsis prolifica TaxID=188132 RepID=UPI0024143AA9|nr:stAR-related lipid transfer protein 5 isoform X1 [Poeciliopsis prolifica]
MDYEHKAKAVADCLLSYRRDESGWKVCRKSNDVVVSWRPSSEFPGNVYKGEGIVSGSPENVWECLKPVPNGLRVKWDSNVKKFELLEQIKEDISICRTVTPSAAMGIIAPRDFVDVILVKQYEDGSISSNDDDSSCEGGHLCVCVCVATNVIHPFCPPHPGYVRGFNHACGCICIPISGEPRKTQVSSFFQTDLGGLLPRSVVDSFFPSSMTEFYSNLAKAVKSIKDM